MIIELPDKPGFFLMENGGNKRRAILAIAIIHRDSKIRVKRAEAMLIFEQTFQSPVYFVLWTDPNNQEISEDYESAEFRFWFTNKEDYTLALLKA